MSSTSDFKNYPFLTGEEFAEVCHHLDRLYCQATLGPLRRQWRLRIVRPLDGELDDGDLASCLENFSFGGGAGDDAMEIEGDKDMMAAEEADESVLPRGSVSQVGRVTYEIHLHPTYQAPCLWFSLRDLPVDEQAFNIDTVFRRLVPDQFKDGLRSAGAVGGISADHHPITGVPSFFVHPCLLGESMSKFDCSKETYLMVWLGLVGGCVGLWVPKEMALKP